MTKKKAKPTRTTLVIDGHEYSIGRKQIKKKDCWAYTDTVTRQIWLATDLPAYSKWDVLGHEIVHVWLNQTGMEGYMTSQILEAHCDMLGTKLVRFLIENGFVPDDNEDDNE